jgi:hypothetical protein
MEDFLANVPLANAFYELRTFITGTIRRNRELLPWVF